MAMIKESNELNNLSDFSSMKTLDPVKSSTSMSKEDWAQKDRRIVRCGNIQIAVQVEPTFEKAVELADKMFAYVYEKRV